ncbi:MAG TPA: TonB family protein [Rhodanobacteraceae bacterium]
MSAFDAFAMVSALGWSLLHFVWQAAVVGMAYALARSLLPRGNPRYVAAMLALVAMAVWPVVTLWRELVVATSVVVLPDVVVASSTTAASTFAAASSDWRAWLSAAVPWLVLAWMLGVGVLGVRVFRQWRGLRAMLRAAEALPVWQARARDFAERLGLRRVVPVLASVRVATPTLVGWVRPAVVLPVAVLSSMPAAQIDLVLAHELAHLKRFDHLANLFQVVLETLFFYHPVVHWISREARNERELCCDALALQATGGARRDFVAALASLEVLRAGHTELALAASGGVLVERAWFIAGAAPQRSRRLLRGNAVLMLVLGALVAFAWIKWRDHASQQRTAALVAANDASVWQHVQRGFLHSPMSLAWTAMATNHPRLAPVAYAAVVAPDTGTSLTQVLIPSINKPSLTLREAAPRLAPLAQIVVAPSARSIVANGPRALHTVRPVYPSAALLNGVQGQAVVEFSLDAQGVPQDLEIIGAGAGPFDAAALQALAQWRFAPPTTSGRRYRQAFTFQLGAVSTHDAATARACLVMTGTHICRPINGALDIDTLRSR